MKYLIYVIAILVLIPYSSSARLTIRVGHPSGTYKTVSENAALTELTCSGDGDLECKYSDGESGMIIYVNGNGVTDAQAGYLVSLSINNNVFQGVVYGDYGIGHYSWTYTPANGTTFIFDDVQ